MDPAAKVFWSDVELLGILGTPTAWFVYAVEYTGQQRRISRRWLVLLSAVPLLAFLIARTNDLHGLMWRELRVHPVGNLSVLDVVYGPAMWIVVAYAYLLFLGATLLLQQLFVRSSHFYRWQR